MQKGVALNQLSGKTQKVLSVQIPDLCSAFLPAKFEAGAYEMGSCDMLSLQVGQRISLRLVPRQKAGSNRV